MDGEFPVGVPFLTGIVVLLSVFLVSYSGRDPLLDAIPTIGYSDPILSYLSAFRYIFLDGRSMVMEGYEKAKPGVFKIPTFRRWIVLPAGAELIEDIKKAQDDVLSRREPSREILQADYTIGLHNGEDAYLRGIVRSKMTRNIASTVDQINDEIPKALEQCIPTTTGEGWVKMSALSTVQRIICRTTSRIFVGSPLCWNPGYQKLASEFTLNLMKVAFIVSLFPKPLKPIIARIFSNIPSQIRQNLEFIRPVIKERSAKMDELGHTWEDAPNDLLMWLMSESNTPERSLEDLARQVLSMNLPSIHSTSSTCTRVLYRLLASPEYIEPLRREVEAVIAEEGWTKAGMDKMHKIDSFLRETQRFDALGIVALSRLALRPFTFSNGVTVPAGAMVALPLCAIHMDEETYSNPERFDGFRFSKTRDDESEVAKGARSLATSTAADYLAFGIGRHACPGRFFAVYEIKALIAYLIMEYDIKLEKNELPRQIRVGSLFVPRNANLLFRKRQR